MGNPESKEKKRATVKEVRRNSLENDKTKPIPEEKSSSKAKKSSESNRSRTKSSAVKKVAKEENLTKSEKPSKSKKKRNSVDLGEASIHFDELKKSSLIPGEYPFYGDEWENEHAEYKYEKLWEAITQYKQPSSVPGRKEESEYAKEITPEQIKTSYEVPGDVLPLKGTRQVAKDKKIMNRNGAVCSAIYVPLGTSPYSGIYKEGSNYCIVRCSAGRRFSDKPKTFVPFVSVKFLRSKVPSANLVCGYSFEGSDSYNFFEHDFSNQMPAISKDGKASGHNLVLDKKHPTEYPFVTGVSNLAEFDETGEKPSYLNFPHKVILQTSKKIRDQFSKEYQNSDIVASLQKIERQTLFYVYAEETPGSPPELIGYIAMTSEFTPSLFADTLLFFKHQKREEDFQYKNWEKPYKTLVAAQSAQNFPNADPDLPQAVDERVGKTKYLVHVYTGDVKGAGTDSHISIKFYGTKAVTDFMKLTGSFRQGGRDTISLDTPFLGVIKKIEIQHKKWGLGSEWYLDTILVEDKMVKTVYPFLCYSWIDDEIVELKLTSNSLPQNSTKEEKEDREKQLAWARDRYQWKQYDGLPPRVKDLPKNERFTFETIWEIVSEKAEMMANEYLSKILNSFNNWDSIEDYDKLYHTSLLRPSVSKYWDTDEGFALNRLQGASVMSIELLTTSNLPKYFKITDDTIGAILKEYSGDSGATIASEMEKKKLFITDYVMVMGGLKAQQDYYITAPIILFQLDKNQTLLPVAIQLFPDENNDPSIPLFTPKDPKNLWTLVKMHANCADGLYHQTTNHLCFTHLCMEGFDVCTKRYLSLYHPVRRLLGPHFLFLMAINSRGFEKLVSPGGWVDKSTSLGLTGFFDAMKRAYSRWNFEETSAPKNFHKRGVTEDVLKYYPYRDDAMSVWNAIHRLATRIVFTYYHNQQDIIDDYELQAWAAALRSEANVKGLPGDGQISNREQLILIISTVIYTCSVQHAAANFPQYDFFGYVPNAPGAMRKPAPTTKDEVDEKFIVSSLPSMATSLDQIAIVKILSTKATNSLGEYERSYLYEPETIAAIQDFRRELQSISIKIQELNKKRKHGGYPHLDPVNIPNSIAI